MQRSSKWTGHLVAPRRAYQYMIYCSAWWVRRQEGRSRHVQAAPTHRGPLPSPSFGRRGGGLRLEGPHDDEWLING